MQTIAQSSMNASFQCVNAVRPARRAAVVVRATSEPILQKPAAPSESAAPTPVASTGPNSAGITIEYQRQQAKAMQAYFKSLKFEETVANTQVFGWTKKNEITNGRWVMMGFVIGLLTEFSTAVNFIDQLKLMVSYMGIADIYD